MARKRAESFVTNASGLTLAQWIRAASFAQGHGLGPGDFGEARRDWEADVDPAEWGRPPSKRHHATKKLPASRHHATKAKRVLSGEWLRGERHGARAAAENVLKHGKSFAALALHNLQANLRRGEDIEDFDRGYTHAYAETLKAPTTKIQELGRPLTAAELDRDIKEALSRKR